MDKDGVKKRKGFLKMLENSLDGLVECEDIDLSHSYHLRDKKLRLPLKNYPIQLDLGASTTLHIYPERPIDHPEREFKADNYLIFNPKYFYKTVSGFIRLEDGDKVVIGSNQGDQRHLLGLSSKLANRHLQIKNDGGNLVFKNLDKEKGTCIAPLIKEKVLNRISKWRTAKLKRLRGLLGPIQTLSPEAALKLLKQVNNVLDDEPLREKNRQGTPGGVVRIPRSMTPFLVGDLHTKVNNLLVVLSQNGFLKEMKKGRACLILLGDAVHNEEQGSLEEMESSLLIMDVILQLKLCFPKQVFYLRGNHDSFSDEISKQGVLQGVLWEKALVNTRGEAYRDAMAEFYDRLPYVAYSRHFIACHAAPPVSKVSYKRLVNIQEHPKLVGELINNRLNRPTKPAGYTKRDVKRFRKCFELDDDTAMIVGHTPMSEGETIWQDVGDIDNHHVIYASDAHWVGVITELDGKMNALRYPVENLVQMINDLPGEQGKG